MGIADFSSSVTLQTLNEMDMTDFSAFLTSRMDGNLVFREDDSTDDIVMLKTLSYSEVFSETERGVLLVYLGAVLLLGICANSFVVRATMKYSTFNLDKITIIFLHHLALTDLLMVIFMAIPMLYIHISRPSHGSPFPGLLCTFLGNVYELLIHAHIMFYLAIAAHRFMRCVYPNKLQSMTSTQGKWACRITWLAAIAITIVITNLIHLVSLVGEDAHTHVQTAANGTELETRVKIEGTHVVFYMGMAMCALQSNSLFWHWFNMSYTSGMMLGIIVLNVGTLLYSSSVNKSSRVKSRKMIEARLAVTVMGLCAVLSNIWAPYLLVHHMIGGEGDVPLQDRVAQDNIGQKLLSHVPIATALVNPLIYTMVNRQFKMFMVREIERTRTKYQNWNRRDAVVTGGKTKLTFQFSRRTSKSVGSIESEKSNRYKASRPQRRSDSTRF